MRMLKPPFEIYDDGSALGLSIADQNGHICTCDNEELTADVFNALKAHSLVNEMTELFAELVKHAKSDGWDKSASEEGQCWRDCRGLLDRLGVK